MRNDPPPQLGADNVIRFLDADHFFRELSGNLKGGRAFVRCRRALEVGSRLSVFIEAPGVQTRVAAAAEVVFTRDDVVGLAFTHFEDDVRPALDRLQGQATQLHNVRAATVVDSSLTAGWTSLPKDNAPLGPDDEEIYRHGVAEIHISEEDENPARAVLSVHSMPQLAQLFSIEGTSTAEPLGRSTRATAAAPEEAEQAEEASEQAREERREEAREEAPEKAPEEAEDDDEATFDLPPSKASLLRRKEAAPGPPTQTRAMPGPSPKESSRSSSSPPPALDVGLRRASPANSSVHRELLSALFAPLPIATRSGVLAISDLSFLLGLYLSEIRHGRLTLLGGPLDPPGHTFPLKIVGPRVATLTAHIVARDGEWLTVRVEGGEEIEAILRDHHASWKDVLTRLVPTKHSVDEPPPPQAEPRPASLRQSRRRNSSSARQIAHLEGNIVTFRTKQDLKRELDNNLRQGGLFVASPALEIRSKHILKFSVESFELPTPFAADVVFAQGDRVGFALQNSAAVVEAVEEFLAETPLSAASFDELDKAASASSQAETSGSDKQNAPQNAQLNAPPTAELNAQPSDAPNTSPDAEEGAFAEAQPPSDPPSVRGDDRVEDFQGPAAPEDDPPFATLQGCLLPPLGIHALLSFQSLRLESGRFRDAPYVLLFDHLIATSARGVLELEHGHRRQNVWFHHGSVAFVESEPFEEGTSLGRVLMTAKKINEAALREALDVSRAQGRSLGHALLALRKVKKSDLSAAIREQTRAKLEAAFSWPAGAFHFEKWRDPPGDADLILSKGIGILGRYVRQRYLELETSEIEALLGKNMRRPVRVAHLAEILPSLALHPKEIRFLEVQIDGQRPIIDAVLGSPLGRLASLRMVALGLTLGFLTFSDGKTILREETKLRAVQEDKSFTRVRDVLEHLSEANHFEALGVHWSAHHRTYREAYQQARQEFNLQRAPYKEAPQEIIEMIKEIHEILDEAFDTLNKADSRVAYRKQLFDKTEREYAADMLVKKGEIALLRGNRVTAIELLETAVELFPSPRNQALLDTARQSRG